MKFRLDAGQIEVMDDDMAAVLRAKTGAQRLMIVDGMFRSAQHFIAAGVLWQYPDWDEEQLKREARRRISRGTV